MYYSAYKLNLDGSLSNRENLDNFEEINQWLVKVHGKFANAKIISNSGKFIVMSDTNGYWEEFYKGEVK